MIGKNYKAKPQWLNLGEGFSDPVKPARFPQQRLRYRNQLWAERMGLGELSEAEWLQHFAEFQPLPDNLPEPLALRYHGHQFTHYNPELGDGRGFLFAQLEDPKDGRLLDLGTKGSGQTPYSRQGDGRLTLKGAVREALATAFLESKGVNTSKTFSVVETGESLHRHDEPSPTRAAVLVRLSHSHVRIGSFQRLAFHKEKQKMQDLIDYSLAHLLTGVKADDFFVEICRRVARTTAQWMMHGFVHGVLNTDNINITGESFDYGPYRFLPHFDPQFTAAYFDHQSLYAYGQQPSMVHWNLQRLQEALQILDFSDDFFDRGFKAFEKEFNSATLSLLCEKIGIRKGQPDEDVQNFFYLCLQFLKKSKAPYEAFFHHLYVWHQDLDSRLSSYSPEFYQDPLIDEIETKLSLFARSPEATLKTKDDFQTLLIDEIEAIWDRIDKEDDWKPFHEKIKALSS